MKKFITLSIVLIAALHPLFSFAQLSSLKLIRDRQEITFDSSGKMISFPLVYLTKNTSLSFKVTVSRGSLTSQLEEFKERLTDTWTNIDTLPLIKQAYPCFFGETIDAYSTGLTALIGNEWKFPCSDKEKQIFISSLIPPKEKGKEDNKEPDNKPDTGKSPFDIASFIPINQLLRNIETQYAVVVNNGNVCLDTIWLEADLGDCSDCIDFTGGGLIKDWKVCTECGIKSLDQFTYKLIHFNPLNRTIAQWNAYQASVLKKDDAKNLKKVLESINTRNCCNDDTEKKMIPYKNWFIGWLWFTKGELRLNPFPRNEEEEELAAKNKIKSLTRKIDSAQQIIIFLDSIKANVKKKLNEISTFSDVLNKRKTTEEYVQMLEKHKKRLEEFLATDMVKPINSYDILYDGVVKLSKYIRFIKPAVVNPMKQFDASMNYTEIPQKAFWREKVKEIPENEHLHFMVHNIPSGTGVKISDSPVAFDDVEEFTKLVDRQLKQINFSDVTESSIGRMQNLTRSFLYKEKFPTRADLTGAGFDSLQPERCKYVDTLADLLIEQIDARPNSFLPAADLFKNPSPIGPRYMTYMQKANEAEAPYKDTIIIKKYIGKDTSIVGKSYASIGKLRFIQLSAGMAISRNPVYTTTLDTSGSGVGVSTQDNAARAIIGFKIYPFKNYNRDNGIIPRYFFRRLSAFAGFEMLHPTHNFYLGGAYDIVPGLAISVGGNWYLQTNYRVRNNEVTDTYSNYKNSGAYYAVTVNPIIFVQFVKLFFK